jgi:hypothetical protein
LGGGVTVRRARAQNESHEQLKVKTMEVIKTLKANVGQLKDEVPRQRAPHRLAPAADGRDAERHAEGREEQAGGAGGGAQGHAAPGGHGERGPEAHQRE